MINPGTVLEQKLIESGMSRKELAQRINVSEKHISTVINGERGISAAFARKLGYVFENTAFWLHVQADYDEEQTRIKEVYSISAEEIELLKPLHDITAYFIERGYMHNDCGAASKVMQLRELLNVSDLLYIPKITYNAAYRAQLSSNVRIDPFVLFAWQRLCEKETESIHIESNLNKQLLHNHLQDIKKMMFGDINDGIQSLQRLLAECGIAFQVVRNFRGAPVQGFIKVTTDHRLILCLTIRGQRADRFWFTLFHEIAHILNDDYTTRFVDFDSVQSEIEAKADAFASNILIDPEQYRQFLRDSNCTIWSAIEAFAESVHVQPFIVLGRLQKDGLLEWSDYPDKVRYYKWVA